MSDNEQSSGSFSELELLKQRARLLGVEFSNNIGLETLRERVAAKMAALDGDDAPISQPNEQPSDEQPNPLNQGENSEDDFDADIEEDASSVEQPAILSTAPIELKPVAPVIQTDLPNPTKSASTGSPISAGEGRPLSMRQQIFNENMKLIRVRIQNLDPKKKDLQGEIFTVSNRYLGTVKRYVPYGDSIDDNGWHLPYVIYKELASRKFLQITTTKDRQTKQIKVVKRWAKEFAFEVLPPLTEKELKALAAAQAAAGSIENNADQIL